MDKRAQVVAVGRKRFCLMRHQDYCWLSYHVVMKQFLRILAVVAGLSIGLAAQPDDNATLQRGSQEFAIWAAYSPDSTIDIGQSEDRKFFEANMQYAITMLAGRHLALKWVSEIVPAALVGDPNEWYFSPQGKLINFRPAATTYAAGITPLGMQLNFCNGHRLQPFLDAHGGMLYFLRQEPIPGSSQFNFAFNFGTGVQIFPHGRWSILAGYKYHHFSNDNTASQNPGVDNGEWYGGYVWRWR